MNNPFIEIKNDILELKNVLINQSKEPHLNHKIKEQQEKPLNTQQAAEWLGVSLQWLYSQTRGETIPFIRKAGRCYFLKSQLLEWLKESQVISIKDIKSGGHDK